MHLQTRCKVLSIHERASTARTRLESPTSIDRLKPIAYQRTCVLSDEAIQLFPNLVLTPQEKEWCNCTPAELARMALERNEYALKVFRKKLQCFEVVDALLSSKPEAFRRGIERLSSHISGGALDKYIFAHAHKIRSRADLTLRIQRILDHLIDAALEESRHYVRGGQPDVIDCHYRNFYVFATTVARLNPALSPALHQRLSRILWRFKREHLPYLFLVSLRALGYKSHEISEWDLLYVQPWQCDPGSEEGQARAANTVAYNAAPTLGWQLMQMSPRDAEPFIRARKHSLSRSLVLEMHRKCCADPCVNVVWLAARFFKLHLTLHLINGRNAYRQLPEDLARSVLKVADTVGRAVRSTSENFPGKVDLKKIIGSIEATLKADLPPRNSRARIEVN